MADAAIMALWQDYKTLGGLHRRNRLIEEYARLVRYVATKVGANLPSSVDVNDLVSYGTFGLIDAIEKFDLEKGVKFETYAITRIRGSIIDELRCLDWVPRSVRSQARAIDEMTLNLEREFGRVPEDHEIAERLGIDMSDLWAARSATAGAQVTTLDDTTDEEGHNLNEVLPDITVSPEGVIQTQEVQNRLSEAVMYMTDRSRLILILYYIEELTLAEIGELLGVTESRVCQLQSKLLSSLRLAFVEGPSAVAA